jgi:U3 small nucleolar RNA-associated protein 14
MTYYTCRKESSSTDRDALAAQLETSLSIYSSSSDSDSESHSDSESDSSVDTQHLGNELVFTTAHLMTYMPTHFHGRLLKAISILCDSDKTSDEDYNPHSCNRLAQLLVQYLHFTFIMYSILAVMVVNMMMNMMVAKMMVSMLMNIMVVVMMANILT